jgi:hypothetical protein
MTYLLNRLTVTTALIVGQSSAQAHNSDSSASSVMHFFTAPDHLSLSAFLLVALCAAALRLKKTDSRRAIKLKK